MTEDKTITIALDTFPIRVYQIVAAIPKGKVTTYGTIAKLASVPSYSRHVGRVLHNLPKDSKLPWYRVINQQGRISLTSTNYSRQKDRLIDEGITFNKNDKIDLKRGAISSAK